MKLRLYRALENTEFKATLLLARRIGSFAIAGFYLTLAIAGVTYLTASPEPGVPVSMMVNQVLLTGISGCLILLAVSGMIAGALGIQRRARKTA